jgi:cytochrome c556
LIPVSLRIEVRRLPHLYSFKQKFCWTYLSCPTSPSSQNFLSRCAFPCYIISPSTWAQVSGDDRLGNDCAREAVNRFLATFFLIATCTYAQAPSASSTSQPVATMKQIMLDLVHPASNEILLVIYRGGPKDDTEWAAVRHNALTLAESSGVLNTPARASDSEWATKVKMLTDAGTAAYKASQARDSQALAATAASIDAACTSCHKQYRPNVFPPQASASQAQGGSK